MSEDARSMAPGMAEAPADDDLVTGGHTDDDRGAATGAADRDADAVRSGADPAEPAQSAREAMLGDYGVDDDAMTDQGEPVGLADRDADVERST
jgi:hypothetical protein